MDNSLPTDKKVKSKSRRITPQNHAYSTKPLMRFGPHQFITSIHPAVAHNDQPSSSSRFHVNPITIKSYPTTPANGSPRLDSQALQEAVTKDEKGLFCNVTAANMKDRSNSGLTLLWRDQKALITAPESLKRSCDDDSSPPPIKRPRLRPSKPIKAAAELDADTWTSIFSLCEPKFLLEARTICSFFNQLLKDRPDIWRASRSGVSIFNVPDCPPELSEIQYAELLFGRGCQSSTCTNERTNRVCWSFLGRFCPPCIKQRCTMFSTLDETQNHTITLEDSSTCNLAELIPTAWGSVGRYDCLRRLRPSDDIPPYRVRNFLFLTSDYNKIEAEYLSLTQRGATTTEISAWAVNKLDRLQEYCDRLRAIEELQRFPPYMHDASVRDRRMWFFRSKAMQLDPPIRYYVLERMAAYQDALRSSNPPSERGWSILKAKLLPWREEAERLADSQKDAAWREANARFRKLSLHRSGRWLIPPVLKPEQQLVITIGEQEFQKSIQAGVADEDLVLLTLHNTYKAFQKHKPKPRALCFDGLDAVYKLSLDDARMIVEMVIEREIPRTSLRARIIYEQFRCIGCSSSSKQRWDFRHGFQHIVTVHSESVGDGHQFWHWSVPFPKIIIHDNAEPDHHYYRFPWYTIAWPKCLPLLPGHRDTTNLQFTWKPDAGLEYVQISKPAATSAFEGRQVCNAGTENYKGFVDDMVFVAGELNGVTISPLEQMKIILSYAFARADTNGAMPTKEDLITARSTLQLVRPTLEFKFRCGACIADETVSRTLRHVKHTLSVEELQKHWDGEHEAHGLDWEKKFLHLPSDVELYDAMHQADEELRHEKEAVESRMANLPQQHRKRQRLKGFVILKTPFVLEIFDRLFPKVDGAIDPSLETDTS